jgi:hypothetical protein
MIVSNWNALIDLCPAPLEVSKIVTGTRYEAGRFNTCLGLGRLEISGSFNAISLRCIT